MLQLNVLSDSVLVGQCPRSTLLLVPSLFSTHILSLGGLILTQDLNPCIIYNSSSGLQPQALESVSLSRIFNQHLKLRISNNHFLICTTLPPDLWSHSLLHLSSWQLISNLFKSKPIRIALNSFLPLIPHHLEIKSHGSSSQSISGNDHTTPHHLYCIHLVSGHLTTECSYLNCYKLQRGTLLLPLYLYNAFL